jgi:hypothetical protein
MIYRIRFIFYLASTETISAFLFQKEEINHFFFYRGGGKNKGLSPARGEGNRSFDIIVRVNLRRQGLLVIL